MHMKLRLSLRGWDNACVGKTDGVNSTRFNAIIDSRWSSKSVRYETRMNGRRRLHTKRRVSHKLLVSLWDLYIGGEEKKTAALQQHGKTKQSKADELVTQIHVIIMIVRKNKPLHQQVMHRYHDQKQEIMRRGFFHLGYQ